MPEQAVMVALIVFYAVLIGICLFMLYQIYNSIMDFIKEMISEIYEEGKNEGKKEKQVNAAGSSETGTELSGSNGGNAEEEESSEWQKKKS